MCPFVPLQLVWASELLSTINPVARERPVPIVPADSHAVTQQQYSPTTMPLVPIVPADSHAVTQQQYSHNNAIRHMWNCR